MAFQPLYRLTDADIHSRNLPDDIGTRWKDLARELRFSESLISSMQSDKDSHKERCIAVLVKWMEREGQQGTCEKLAIALANIGLQNLAERLIGMWLGLCIRSKEYTEGIALGYSVVKLPQACVAVFWRAARNLEREQKHQRSRGWWRHNFLLRRFFCGKSSHSTHST